MRMYSRDAPSTVIIYVPLAGAVVAPQPALGFGATAPAPPVPAPPVPLAAPPVAVVPPDPVAPPVTPPATPPVPVAPPADVAPPDPVAPPVSVTPPVPVAPPAPAPPVPFADEALPPQETSKRLPATTSASCPTRETTEDATDPRMGLRGPEDTPFPALGGRRPVRRARRAFFRRATKCGQMVAMSFRRASILLGLCLAPGTLSGCVFSQPQSLVATNIRPTSDPLTAGRRVEAEVCGNRLLGISFGPEPRMTTVMDALQAEAPGAIGFEDIRIDTSW